MLTLPTQEELDKLRRVAEKLHANRCNPNLRVYKKLLSEYYDEAESPLILRMLDLIAAQQKQIAEQGWISVKERMPPLIESVLVTNGVCVKSGSLDLENGVPSWFDTMPVTHWKPLPPPPEPA